MSRCRLKGEINIDITGRRKKQKLKILFDNNTKSIASYNANIFSTLILAGIIVMSFPILVSPLSQGKTRLVPLYLLSIVLLLVLFLLFQLKPLKNYPILGVYLVFLGSFLFSIYLSVINSQNQRATIIIGLFCVFPMSIIDRPYRIKIFSVAMYLMHTVLAFILKGFDLGVDDLVNCFCFLTLGNAVGDRLIQIRLEAFESKRLLIIEKETDDLTGLKNRRKMLQLISEFESGGVDVPSGAVMLDIDNFKEYNDRYGHSAGDRLLRRLSEILLSFEKIYRVQFFRYGGDEFAGFSWGYTQSEIKGIFEEIKAAVNAISDCRREIGVSIGIADCRINSFCSIEKCIELADKALYRAKADGKNKLVLFNKSKDSDVFCGK